MYCGGSAGGDSTPAAVLCKIHGESRASSDDSTRAYAAGDLRPLGFGRRYTRESALRAQWRAAIATRIAKDANEMKRTLGHLVAAALSTAPWTAGASGGAR